MPKFHVRANTTAQLRDEMVRWIQSRIAWALGERAQVVPNDRVTWDMLIIGYADALKFWRDVRIERRRETDSAALVLEATVKAERKPNDLTQETNNA